MGTLGVIEPEVVTNPDPGISSILICFQIHFLIFHCAPQPLDEQVVVMASLPIHTDFHSILLQEPGEGFTGKLRSLVGVEDIQPKVISEALGHSSVAFTMDTYSHIIELLDEVLPAGTSGRSRANAGSATPNQEILASMPA